MIPRVQSRRFPRDEPTGLFSWATIPMEGKIASPRGSWGQRKSHLSGISLPLEGKFSNCAQSHNGEDRAYPIEMGQSHTRRIGHPHNWGRRGNLSSPNLSSHLGEERQSLLPQSNSQLGRRGILSSPNPTHVGEERQSLLPNPRVHWHTKIREQGTSLAL